MTHLVKGYCPPLRGGAAQKLTKKKIYTKHFDFNRMKLKCLVYDKNDIKVNIIPFLLKKIIVLVKI